MSCICKRRYTVKCESCDFRHTNANKRSVIEAGDAHINHAVGDWPDEDRPNINHVVLFREDHIMYHTWDERREEGDDW